VSQCYEIARRLLPQVEVTRTGRCSTGYNSSHLIYTSVSKEAIMSALKGAAKLAAKPAAPVQAPKTKVRRSRGRQLVEAKPAAQGALAKRSKASARSFLTLFRSNPQERIEIIRRGIPSTVVEELSTSMGISKDRLIQSLGLARATINRKERDGKPLSSDESERVLGVENLIGMVQTMVEQSGNPEGFDAPRWVSAWLAQPLPALGGATPASYMDTFEGQKLVAEILAMSQSGAYA
jgi:putative toxin-antitoxin system antitoxin component (TIGR02293 family)